MTKKQILDNTSYKELLYLLLPKKQAEDKFPIVKQFFRWDHRLKGNYKEFPLEKGTLNMILIVAVHHTLGDFNDVYLRRILETFLDERIYSTSQAIDYFEKYLEQQAKNERTSYKRGIHGDEPEWIDDIMNSIGDEWNL